METTDERTSALIAEAARRNESLRQLADEGAVTFSKANPFVRVLLGKMIRSGVGMSIDELGVKVREFSALLARLRSGQESLEAARPAIRDYAGLTRKAIAYVESLESMSGRIKDHEQRARIIEMTRARVEDTRRLTDVLDELGGAR